MNTIGKRRWNSFKSNKKAYYSLWIFAIIFGISLLANVLINDRPLIVYYKGGFYFPIVKDYPESVFGGNLASYTDYKDPYIEKSIDDNGFMLMPLVEFSYNTINYDLPKGAPSAPTLQNWLGTDDGGRDVLARLVYGFRLSVVFGLVLTALSSVIGILAGAIQGYFGGKIDLYFQRFLEIWGALPQMFILVMLSSLIVPSFWSLLIILLCFSWTALIPVVRAEVLKARNLDYVKAARSMGVGEITIMLRHVLPNAFTAALTYIPFVLCGSITLLTALDFLGLGLGVGEPSLGDILRQGKENLQAPWLGLSGFFVIGIVLSLLIFIGEGLRDAFNPRKMR